MKTKALKKTEEQKLIKRAIDMYIFVHGKEPMPWWCADADRAKFLIQYYKENYNIIAS